MAIYNAATKGTPVTMQDAQATGNGTVFAIPGSFREHILTITGSAGVASGAVQPETSDDPAYAGTWAPQGSPVTVVADTKKTVNISGTFRFMRCRISTTIGSGTVTVTYEGS